MPFFFYERTFDRSWCPVITSDHPKDTETAETRKSKPDRSPVYQIDDHKTIEQCEALFQRPTT